MRVCLDIQAGVAQRAGVGRYTKMLAQGLDGLAGSGELRLAFFDFQRKGMPFPVTRAELRAIRWCPGRLAQGAWKTIGWPPFDWFAGAADVYHFPNFVLPPLRRGRAVVTIHDASFVRFPHMAEERNLRYLRARIEETVRRADAIITDSQFSAREIVSLLGADASRVFPIHPGISPDMTRQPDDAVRRFRERQGLARPYLLTVGTIEPRKNIPFLIEVFEKLTFFDGDLVIAGMPGWKFEPTLERMKHSSRADRIRYLRYVPDAEMPALYSGADVFVFPSLYEGFGFPPLEAMACGTPVVSSTGGSLPEALGNAAIMVPTFACGDWVGAIRETLGDNASRARLANGGRQWAKRYTWEKTAAATWEVYRRLCP